MSVQVHTDTQPKIESISYSPGLQDTGDLEPAAKSITAVTEPGTPDYAAGLTIPTPADSRLQVKRICVRLQVDIDSWSGGNTLHYRIKRGGVSIKDGTLTTSGGTGSFYSAVDVTDGTLTGAANYDIFLWVDAGSCTVSGCRLWAAVGSNAGYAVKAATISHRGLMTLFMAVRCQGSGSPYGCLTSVDMDANNGNLLMISGSSNGTDTFLIKNDIYIGMWGSLITDINYFDNVLAILNIIV